MKWLITQSELRNTHFITSEEHYKELLSNNNIKFSRGYAYLKSAGSDFEQDQDITEFNLTSAGAAGAIVSIPSDINLFMFKLFKDGSILSPNQLNKMKSMVREKPSYYDSTGFFKKENSGSPVNIDSNNRTRGYGLGIMQQFCLKADCLIYFHEGSTHGYQCAVIFFEDDKTIITAMGNHDFPVKNLSQLILVLKQTCKNYRPEFTESTNPKATESDKQFSPQFL